MITLFSCRFDRFLSSYRFILNFDYCSFTGVDIVSLQITSLYDVHRFIMMSPRFKAILNFVSEIICEQTYSKADLGQLEIYPTAWHNTDTCCFSL